MTDPSPFRSVAWLLIAAAVGSTAARVVHVERVFEPSLFTDPAVRKWPATAPAPQPTLQSNDRSRWATVRALGDHYTFAIGTREQLPDGGYRDSGIIKEDGWGTVDVVLHPERQTFYSSKPPLFPVLLAGEYKLLKRLFGWEITDERGRWYVVAVILVTVNVVPFLLFLWGLTLVADRFGLTEWGKLFVVTAACFGTFLATFATTLNNHTPAACAVLFALWAVLTVPAEPAAGWFGSWGLPGSVRPRRLAAAGFFAGLAATFDLPALGFTAGLGALVTVRQPKLAFGVYLPAALVPIAALLLTNYAAFETVVPVYEKFGTEWYNFPGSHWSPRPDGKPKTGIDFAEEPKHVVLFHNLIGHHGLFSLTPVWLLAVGGAVALLRRPSPGREGLRGVGALALALTAVVVAFYTWKQNNYGGWTAGPRWFFWLTPLWLVALLPAADRLARSRAGRGVAGVLLAASAFSAAWPAWNPWRHPWTYALCEWMGWVKY